MKKQYEETGDSSVVIFVYRNPLPLEAIQNVTTSCRVAVIRPWTEANSAGIWVR
jgi:hypothetical protein